MLTRKSSLANKVAQQNNEKEKKKHVINFCLIRKIKI